MFNFYLNFLNSSEQYNFPRAQNDFVEALHNLLFQCKIWLHWGLPIDVLLVPVPGAPFTSVPGDDLFLLSPAAPSPASRDDLILKSATDPFSPCGRVGGCPAGEQVEKGNGNLFKF